MKKKKKNAKKTFKKIKKLKTHTKKINLFEKPFKKLKLAKKVRVPTGIPKFDELIEGGFEKYSTNLIVGGSGSGKSIFATQFIMEGMKKGEKCLYVTFEEKKNQFYDNMLRFGWDLEKYEKKELFTFLEYSPIKVKTMLEEGGGTIESLVITNKITRIVIDSITSFALLFKDELERREAALSLFNMIRKWSCTSLLTSEEDPLGNEKTSKSLEFESDAIIILYYLMEKRQRKRYLEILKMRGTKHSKQIYGFSIGKGGITLESGESFPVIKK